MKKVLILLACAAAIVACSKEEPIAINQGQAISFSSPFINKATRAVEVTTDNLSSFNVWGTVTGSGGAKLIYDGSEITDANSDGEWECAGNPQYWVEDANYAFTAIKNHTSVTPASGMPTAINAIVNTTTGAADLILAQEAVNNVVTATQGAVSLTFSHLMSKVGFTVISNATGNYTHTVRNITVENFSEGTYTIGTGWESTTDATIQFGDIEDVDDTSGKSNGSLLLIPNTDPFKVSFEVDFEKDGTVLRTVKYTTDLDAEFDPITVNNDLVAGYSYNFIIELSAGKEIKFTPTVAPWTDPATDVNVQ